MGKINSFEEDIITNGRYKYTESGKYSTYIATKRQSEEIITFIKKYLNKNPSILDVGCGDGTWTLELLKKLSPKKIVGFDYTESAIEVAKAAIEKEYRNKIEFLLGDAHETGKMFKKNSFDLILLRGVLHHLDDPQKAIKSFKNVSKKIIVHETNGYNPILKVIEKTSPYHIKHEEKSYWPPTLNKWFKDAGYKVKEQYFFGIIPYFCPTFAVKILKFIEPIIEKVPLLKNILCGANMIYYEKE